MDWRTLVGLLLLAGAGWFGRDIIDPPKTPWPPYAQPQARCGPALANAFDGTGVRFKYPSGWKTQERLEDSHGVVETFLAPEGGGAAEVMLLIREMRSGGVGSLVGRRKAPAEPMRDAPAEATAPSGMVAGTRQEFAIDAARQGYGYLTRAVTGDTATDSWMVFIWTGEGKMAMISGPKLPLSYWPPRRDRNRQLNCVFWDVIRTVEPK